MKKVFLFFLTAIFFQNVPAQNPAAARPAQTSADFMQYGIKIEPDKRLIIVMTALEAGGGLNTSLTPTGEAFRQKVRADFSNVGDELKQKIQAFIAQRKQKNSKATSAELAAPFVSLAYALSPAPDLGDPAKSAEMPADLLEMLDFAPLVREFYRRSGIEAKMPEYIKAHQAEGDKMRGSTAKMVSELLGYLHTRPELSYAEKIKTEGKDPKSKKTVQKVESRFRERRFFIVPDLLAPEGSVNLQNVGDDYFAIVPPNTDLSRSDARRAYLQFVVDPLVLKNAKDITPLREGIKVLLDERRKTRPNVSPDVFLAVSRSLVAAIDSKEIEYQKVQAATITARQKIDAAQGVEAKKAVSAELAMYKQSLADETTMQLSEAYERGAVLAFYFADQLKGLEDSGFDIAGSLRDIILSLDPTKEVARPAQYAPVRQRVMLARESARGRKLELPKKLLDVNELIKNKKFTEADAALKRLLEENPGESRIYYNLGRVSSILAQPDITFDESLRDKRLDDAKAYYSNAIRTANKETDPALIQLSYVALGRIYEFYDENETALKIYETAIKLGDVQGGAYKEAVAAKANLMKKP